MRNFLRQAEFKAWQALKSIGEFSAEDIFSGKVFGLCFVPISKYRCQHTYKINTTAGGSFTVKTKTLRAKL